MAHPCLTPGQGETRTQAESTRGQAQPQPRQPLVAKLPGLSCRGGAQRGQTCGQRPRQTSRAQQCELGASPLPTQRGHLHNNPQASCDQLGSWGGPRGQDDHTLDVCPPGKGRGQERAGRAPILSHGRGSWQSGGPGLGEGTKVVPTPVRTGSSSSLAPEPPRGPCPSPCCAVRQDKEREQTTGTPDRRNCSRFSK